MTRTKGVGDGHVVLASRIFVADEKRDRRTGGTSLEHAGENLHGVRFAPLRHMPRRSGLAAIELALDVGGLEQKPRGTAVDHASDRRAMRLTEGSNAEQLAECVAGHGSNP